MKSWMGRLMAIAGIAGLALTWAGCDREDGNAETVGEEVDQALNEAGNLLEKAAQKTGEGLEKAAEKTGEGLEKAGQEIQRKVRENRDPEPAERKEISRE